MSTIHDVHQQGGRYGSRLGRRYYFRCTGPDHLGHVYMTNGEGRMQDLNERGRIAPPRLTYAAGCR